MSEITRNSLEKILPQLKCHFTWNLFKEGTISTHMDYRVYNQIEFLNAEFKATMYNLLAYIKHLHGENEAALECLEKAEGLLQQEQAEQAEIRSLVTWGNYAWVYYHMGRLTDAQAYVEKVRQVCEKFANPYSMECPELDCEEGWTRLKCGRNERAKVCFEKALEEKPGNPEFSAGLAIATYRLDGKPQKQFPVSALRQAVELSPNNQYVKVLLALKLQKMKEEAEGQRLVDEALAVAPGQTDVLRQAAQFYRKKGDLDKAIELLLQALDSTANNSHLYYYIMYIHREKVKKMQEAGESEASGRGELIGALRKWTVEYMKKALEGKPNSQYLCFDRGEFEETERCYQMAFSQELPSEEERQLYESYFRLQEQHGQPASIHAQTCSE
uniref:interferon-induced protein with tetratricopeptide repeats 3 n=1 Tax=Jaculus jaculus TaxID=51337 RepID=UPI001E1B1B42|nr:interferon-induced protein with tetratricopeptide repeats 3 [Jaculus jaculus]